MPKGNIRSGAGYDYMKFKKPVVFFNESQNTLAWSELKHDAGSMSREKDRMNMTVQATRHCTTGSHAKG